MASEGEVKIQVVDAGENNPKACYDNPLFHEEDDRDFSTAKGAARGGGSSAAGQAGAGGGPGDGHMATAKDYMHSLPASSASASAGPRPLPDVHFGRKTRQRCLTRLMLVVLGLVIVGIVIGLIVHFADQSKISRD